MLTGGQQTNLCDEVNSGNHHVAALEIGVPSPSVAREYELSVSVGNIGKLCKRHRLPVSRARQRISPYLFILCSAFEVAGAKGRINFIQSVSSNKIYQKWQVEQTGGDAEGLQVAFDLFLFVFRISIVVK